jgi:hypothetical protein
MGHTLIYWNFSTAEDYVEKQTVGSYYVLL